MISETNQKAIEAAGLSFIFGIKIPDVPWPAGSGSLCCDYRIYYQSGTADLHGID